MPAVSKAQRRFFAICEHSPAHAIGHCPKLTTKQFHDFASTKEKGLPVKKNARWSFSNISGTRWLPQCEECAL